MLNLKYIRILKYEYDIRIVWRAFPLHPDIPEGGLLIKELFANNISLMNDKMQQLENKAATRGLPLAKRTMISDSRLCQELGKWAETKGRRDEYHDAIYNAYFVDGLDIAEKIVLLDVAQACRLPRDEARSILENKTLSKAVDRDWKKYVCS